MAVKTTIYEETSDHYFGTLALAWCYLLRKEAHANHERRYPPAHHSLQMAAPSLLRGTPLLRLRLQHHRLASALFKPPGRLTFLVAAADSSKPERLFSVNDRPSILSAKDPTKYPRLDDPNYRKWKIKEAEILRDIEPIIYLTKDILHSDR